MYSAGDLSAHVSASDTNNRVAAVAAYSMSGWTVALGGQDSDDTGDTEFTATIGGTIGGVSVGLAYADNGTNGDKTVLSGSLLLARRQTSKLTMLMTRSKQTQATALTSTTASVAAHRFAVV